MSNSKVEKIIKVVTDYEDKLRKEGPLVTNVELNLSKKSIKDFLLDFFYYNHLQSTDTDKGPNIYSGTFRSNLLEKPIGERQCDRGRRRSIGDLFQIALGHYSKDVSLLQVMEAVYDIINDRTPISTKDGKYMYYMYTCVCSTIRRRVFTTSSSHRSNYTFARNSSEYGSQGNDEFTVMMEDYIVLKETGTFEKHRLEREKKVKVKTDVSDLDRLVAEKVAQLLSGDSDEKKIVKPAKKKLVS